jgi:hypothetical protein
MATRYCKGCTAVVQGAWWCAGCKAARGKKPTSSRYGGEHQRKRAAERDQAYSKPCARCGRQLEPGQPIHLDHAADGHTYLGWSHSTCNLSAGGRKGRAIQTGRLVVNGTAVTTPTVERDSVLSEAAGTLPPEQCPQCGRAACRRPSGLVSRCW